MPVKIRLSPISPLQLFLMLLLPVALLTGSIFFTLDNFRNEIQVTENELAGIHEILSLYDQQKLMLSISGHGLLQAEGIGGIEEILASNREALRSNSETILAEYHAETLGVTKPLSEIMKAVAKLDTPTNHTDSLQHFRAYTRQINRLQEIIRTLWDTGSFSIDPSVETTHLSQILTLRLPALSESIGRVRALSAYQQIGPHQRSNQDAAESLKYAKLQIRTDLDRLEWEIRVLREHAHTSAALIKQLESLVSEINTYLAKPSTLENPKETFSFNARYIDLVHKAATASASRFNEQLQQRLITLNGKLTLSVLGTLLALVLLLFSTAWLYRRNKQAFDEIRHYSEDLKEAEVLQRSILDTVADGIITIDEHGIIKSFNPVAERIFGYSARTVIGSNIKTLMPEPYSSEHDGYLQAYQNGGPPRIIGIGREVRGKRSDGSTFPMDLAVNRMDIKGKRMFTGVVRDITERKKSEDELALFRQMIETSGDPFFLIDDDDGCRMMYVNEAAVRHFGAPREEIYTWRIPDWDPNFSHEKLPQHVEEIKKIRNLVIETTHRVKDGQIVPVEISINLIQYKGRMCHFGYFKNISERKRIEKMKNEFISTVSHELRTPLTSIRGSLGLISGGVTGKLPEQAEAMLKIASNNTERLLMLINDLLDIQKMEAGKMNFRFETLKLMPLVEQAISDMTGYADQHKVRFIVSHRLDDARVYVDRDRLLQVLANLMSNAAKFSPPHSDVEISVARHHDNRLRIAITDNGPGIPKEFMPRMFEHFSQSDSSDTRKGGGTGLGLAIVKAIIERHGGMVSFITREGIGTTFYFELPEMRGSSIENTTQPSKLPGHHCPCVLIVEDDADIAALIQRMLTEAGLDSDIAHTAAEARKRLSERGHLYRLMTLDVMLPDEDGMSLLSSLRRQEATRNLPVVIVSAKADDVKRSLAGGAIGVLDWLSKPIDTERLIAVVKQSACHNQMPRVLHVEDEVDVRSVVAELLKNQCELHGAATLWSAKEALTSQSFDLVLLDIGLPDGSGLDLIDPIQRLTPPPRIVIFSAMDVAREYADKVSATLVKSHTGNQELLRVLIENMRVQSS